jgi:hypothetical protein
LEQNYEDRYHEVLVTPCIVTKKFDKCVRVKLGQVLMPDGETAIITGTFSRDGLLSLMTDLDAVENPLELPTPDEIRANALYHWGVIMKDGEHYQQYQEDGSETPFSAIHIPEVQEFWIIPRRDPEELPWYGLIRGIGFVRRANGNEGMVTMDLPLHEDEFWFQYTRNITVHFGIAAGQKEVLPPRTVQVLGWRVGETICEIGIEEDGNWQVWRMEPVDDPRWKSG